MPGGDLPRVAATGKARIGDSRNDENLIVAQLHLAFLSFHNTVVDWVVDNEPLGHRRRALRPSPGAHPLALPVRSSCEDFLRRIA